MAKERGASVKAKEALAGPLLDVRVGQDQRTVDSVEDSKL